MKLIIALKDDKRRKEFIDDFRKSSRHQTSFNSCLAFVSLVKDNAFAEAGGLLQEITRDATQLNFDTEDPRDIFEYVAVLWAQRERVGDPLSREQANLIDDLFSVLGRHRLFLNQSSSPPDRLENIPKANYPKSVKRVSTRAIHLVVRENFWGDGTSRRSELAARLEQGFAIGGWKPTVWTPESFREALQRRAFPQGALILADVEAIGIQECAERIPQSGLRWIALPCDFHHSYSVDPESWRAIMRDADVFWCTSHKPSQIEVLEKCPTWTDFPFIQAIEKPATSELTARIGSRSLKPRFVGSIERTNLPRIIHFIRSRLGRASDFDISSHMADGLDPLSSYRLYLDRLMMSQCVLNFSVTYAGERIVTGRPTEAFSLGLLLFQEYAPTLHRWFDAGVHFASFDSEAGLAQLCHEMQNNHEKYETIRRQGHNFYWQNYSQRALVSHFSYILDQR